MIPNRLVTLSGRARLADIRADAQRPQFGRGPDARGTQVVEVSALRRGQAQFARLEVDLGGRQGVDAADRAGSLLRGEGDIADQVGPRTATREHHGR